MASYDLPGVGGEPLPAELRGFAKTRIDRGRLAAWRVAGAERGLAEVDRLGWREFLLVSDSQGIPTAVELAARRRPAVLGVALGHAALSSASEGPRAPVRGEIWTALGQLARQGGEAFVRYGLAQMTRGGIAPELAEEMIERFPDMNLAAEMIDAIGREREPIGERLRALEAPLLLGKHEGCLVRTDEGFDDIVAAFPGARTAICPEPCSSSPTFAEALRGFCESLGA